MTQAESLYHLQEIDLNLIQRQKRLSEIVAGLSNNQIILNAQTQLTNAEQRLNPLQRKARQLEQEIQSNAQKIQLTDEQLYSGRVRNPKELQDMQNEIQSLKKRNVELEDVLLETMLAVEEAEVEVANAQQELQTVQASWEQDHSQLLDEQTKIKTELVDLQQKREQALPAVTPESLKTYNTLRPRKNNQPIALLVNQSCSVCRVEQDMTIIGEARKGQKLTFCSSCGRILLYRSG